MKFAIGFVSLMLAAAACTQAQGKTAYTVADEVASTACLLAKSETAASPLEALAACALAPELIDVAKILWPVGQANAAAKRVRASFVQPARDQFGTFVLVAQGPCLNSRRAGGTSDCGESSQ